MEKLRVATVTVQKYWRMVLAKEKTGLLRGKGSKLLLKKVKQMDKLIFQISISLCGGNFECRVYDIVNKLEHLLVLFAGAGRTAQEIYEKLSFSQVKGCFLNEIPQQVVPDWGIVARLLKKINDAVYLFHFYCKKGKNLLKIRYFEIGTTLKSTQIIETDIDIFDKTPFQLQYIIKSDIVNRLEIVDNALTLQYFNESKPQNIYPLNQLIKLQSYVIPM